MAKKPLVIDDDYPDTDSLFLPARGCVPRDWKAQPVKMAALPTKTIPRTEWSARIKERQERKQGLGFIRRRGNFGKKIPSLQQGSYGYCWSHSGVSAHMVCRARDNQPYVPLSAFAIAATIKGGRNQGGWGAEALAFQEAKGVPSQKFWPQGNASLSLGTKECWKDAAQRKVTESWMDVDLPVWGRKMGFEQVVTLLLMDNPGIGDFNWWGHSVCLLDVVEVEANSFGIEIWNSWGDEWGDDGIAILRGEKAVPDAASFIQTVTASAA